MKEINFSKITKCHDIGFAQRLYPQVAFCNKMIAGNYDEEYTANFIEDIYSKWDGKNDLFPPNLVKEYLPHVPKGCLDKGMRRENVVVFWLSYLLGIKCSSLGFDEIMRLLSHLCYSQEGDGFIYGYRPNDEVMEKLDCSAKTLLRGRRRHGSGGHMDDIVASSSELLQKQLIKDICHGSLCSDFHLFSDEVGFLLDCMLRCGLYDKWVTKIMEMEFPHIQVVYCELIREPESFVELYKASVGFAGKDTKLLRCMLINGWMEALASEQCMYMQHISENAYEEEVLETYSGHKREFLSSLDGCIDAAVSLFNDNEEKGVLFDWISHKVQKKELNDANKAYNIILGKVQTAVKGVTDANDLSIGNDDLRVLAATSQLFAERQVGADRLQELWDKVLTTIKSTNRYISLSLEDSDLQEYRAFSRQFADIPSIDEIFKNLGVIYEGINAMEMSNWGKAATKECYVFCILLMVAEDDLIDRAKRVSFFNELTSELIRQSHCCGMASIVQQDYQIPLMLAELIADQILNECKEHFEVKVSKEIYDKGVVMRILSAASRPIAHEAVEEVRKYREGSWKVERQKYLNKRMKKNVDEMEKLFARICE